ncbi:hypothetical protein SAMN04488132_11235 [Sediminibacterium ginsengisoli]|uniref:Uncharacterized protein n=1 Tax=Sediminibacterium ginsengisoli TaxID=413434 RepID=A0A1T4RG17_9BACT|nr:hypothetical protein SAMN04488132_11235 [Sediminibacterium ginsengisoli]
MLKPKKQGREKPVTFTTTRGVSVTKTIYHNAKPLFPEKLAEVNEWLLQLNLHALLTKNKD